MTDTHRSDLYVLLESPIDQKNWGNDWKTTVTVEDDNHSSQSRHYRLMTPMAVRRCAFFAKKADEDGWVSNPPTKYLDAVTFDSFLPYPYHDTPK